MRTNVSNNELMRTNQTNCIFVRLCISANLLIGIDNCCSNKGTWCKCCNRTTRIETTRVDQTQHIFYSFLSFKHFWLSFFNLNPFASSYLIKPNPGPLVAPLVQFGTIWSSQLGCKAGHTPFSLSSFVHYGFHNSEAKLFTS